MKVTQVRQRKKLTPANRNAAARVEAVLDGLAGRVNENFDRRRRSPDPERLPPRKLSVSRERELFRDCVLRDYDYLMGLRFAAPAGFLEKLLPQSILGRALNGHGWFTESNGRPLLFVDASFDRICSILEKSRGCPGHLEVRAWRNRQIERLVVFLEKHCRDSTLLLEDREGSFFGIEFLRAHRVARKPFVKGLVLAGQMDEVACRRRALALAPFTFNGEELELGYGSQEVVDPLRLDQLGLGDTGARAFTCEQLTQLRDLGVVRQEKQFYDYPKYDQAYFRQQMGEGVSDDLALLFIGRVYGFDAMLGAFLADAVDTYDKYLLQAWPGGLDGHLVDRLSSWSWRYDFGPVVEEMESARLINFAARRNQPITRLSSSHRRLIQYEGGSQAPTLLWHWQFLQGKPLPRIRLGFHREPAERFYETAWRRFRSLGLLVPKPVFQDK